MTKKYLNINNNSTIIKPYMEMMNGYETATIYDFFGALSLISMAAGRQTYVNRPNASVFLNTYIIFCADSGKTRKSTAVKKIAEIASQYNDELCKEFRSKYLLIESQATASKIIVDMNLHNQIDLNTQVMFVVSELTELLSGGSASKLPSLLTDWFDCPSQRISSGTNSYGSIHLKNIYPVFLSASTPAWLFKNINPTIISGGFTSRCFFIQSNSKKRSIPWSTEKIDNKDQIVEAMKNINNICSTNLINLNPQAIELYSNWYNKKKSNFDNDFENSFATREADHVLKIAGLLAIDDQSYIINMVHLKRAIECVNDIRKQSVKLFQIGASNKPTRRLVEKLITVCMKSGQDGLSTTAIYNKLKNEAKAGTVRQALLILVEWGQIQTYQIKRGVKPQTYFIWNHEKYIDRLVDKLCNELKKV